jgi:hypothetical protein
MWMNDSSDLNATTFTFLSVQRVSLFTIECIGSDESSKQLATAPFHASSADNSQNYTTAQNFGAP